MLPAMVELSVIIPIRNEAPGLVELHRELTDTLERWGRSYEIIAIDDGSTDDSFAVLSRLHALDPRLRVIRFRRNFGQTAAFSAGFAHARGRLIVTFDGDLQNDPRDIPAMIAKLESGYDIVCGWRKDRKDAFVSRTVPSMLANRLISWATGVRLHDYGCSLKVFRAEVVKPLRLYGEMHRFIPAIASEQGVAITEVVVNHRSRQHGTSNYGISRTIRVVLDLLTVKFLLSYSTRPLQIFGLIGFTMALLGRARRSVAHLREVRRSRTGDCRPAAAPAVDPSDLHGRTARHARTARRNAGAHLSRVAEEADLRHPRGPRSGNDVVTEKRSGGGQRRIAWVLLLASAAAVLVTGLIGTALILAQLGGGPDARSPRFWVGLAAAAALTIASLMLRSLRWVFLLRRAQVRIPIRDAYIGYFAGLSLLLTPFLLGEIAVRAAVLRARGRVPTATVVVVNLWERLLDLVALGIMAGVLAIPLGRLSAWTAILLALCLLTAVPPVLRACRLAAEWLARPAAHLFDQGQALESVRLSEGRTWLVGIVTSGLLPWLVAAGITLAAVLQIQRRRGPWLLPLAAGIYGALIFLAGASVLATRVPAGERQETARRGAVDVLWALRPAPPPRTRLRDAGPRQSARRVRAQPHRGRGQWSAGSDSTYHGGSGQSPGRELSGTHLVYGRVRVQRRSGGLFARPRGVRARGK